MFSEVFQLSPKMMKPFLAQMEGSPHSGMDPRVHVFDIVSCSLIFIRVSFLEVHLNILPGRIIQAKKPFLAQKYWELRQREAYGAQNQGLSYA